MAKGDLHRLKPHQSEFLDEAGTDLFRETGEVRPLGPVDAGTWHLSRNGTVCRVPPPAAPVHHIGDGVGIAIMAARNDTPQRILEPAFNVDPVIAASIHAVPTRDGPCGPNCKAHPSKEPSP